MRWFIGLHPKYFGSIENTKRLLNDFLASGADVLYTHIDYIRVGVDYQMKNRLLVFFVENATNDPAVWESMPSLLKDLKSRWGEVFITGPTDRQTREIVGGIFPTRNFFPLWLTLPFTYRLYQKKVEPSYGDYLLAWAHSPIKGREELEAASVFIPLKIHDYRSGGPTVWSGEMHFKSRGLIWASRLDSIARAFTSAALSRKPAVILRTGAQLFNVYGDSDSEFFNVILLGENTWDWLLSARRVLDNLDYATEWGLRLHQFFEKHEELWKWEIVWERFKDQTGIRLPKDMTPVHHLGVTFFGTPRYFDNEEYFPQGPWSSEPPSVNWEVNLGF
jgi:hypothetical protein